MDGEIARRRTSRLERGHVRARALARELEAQPLEIRRVDVPRHLHEPQLVLPRRRLGRQGRFVDHALDGGGYILFGGLVRPWTAHGVVRVSLGRRRERRFVGGERSAAPSLFLQRSVGGRGRQRNTSRDSRSNPRPLARSVRVHLLGPRALREAAPHACSPVASLAPCRVLAVARGPSRPRRSWRSRRFAPPRACAPSTKIRLDPSTGTSPSLARRTTSRSRDPRRRSARSSPPNRAPSARSTSTPARSVRAARDPGSFPPIPFPRGMRFALAPVARSPR